VGAAGAVECHWEDVLALQNCPFRAVATDNNRCKMPQSGMRGRNVGCFGSERAQIRIGAVEREPTAQKSKDPSCPVTVMSMISDATLPSVPEPIHQGEHRIAIAAIPALALLLERHAYYSRQVPSNTDRFGVALSFRSQLVGSWTLPTNWGDGSSRICPAMPFGSLRNHGAYPLPLVSATLSRLRHPGL
jgi:hypothetical protein